MVVEKIVKLTQAQLKELIKNGQIEIDGELKLYDPQNTFYDVTDRTEDWLYQLVMDAVVRPYKINHTAVITKTLEQEYESLIEENPTLKYKSAVGFRAFLSPGACISAGYEGEGDGSFVVGEGKNLGICYINSQRVYSDYTYTGENSELVTVFYFSCENNGINLEQSFDFTAHQLYINVKDYAPVVADNLVKYATDITSYGYVFTRGQTCCRNLKIYGVSNTSLMGYSGGSVETFETDANLSTFVNNGRNIFADNASLKLIKMPNLQELQWQGTGYPQFFNYKNPDLVIQFNNLRIINCTASQPMFTNVVNVIIPESVVLMQGYICKNNTNITLNCKNAESIANGWCSSTPTGSFTMCTGWLASVNIATAAKNWTKAMFIDFFENGLASVPQDEDTTGGGVITNTRQLTIPIAIFNELTPEDLQIPTDKYWIIQGA